LTETIFVVKFLKCSRSALSQFLDVDGVRVAHVLQQYVTVFELFGAHLTGE